MTVALSPTDRLLLVALSARSADDARRAARSYLDSVDLQVIPWSQSRLLPTLYKRMTDLGERSPDLMRGTYRRAWSQNQLRFRAVAVTMAKLDAEGITNVVLKGASLVPAYGGDWGVRDMSDVDLLVPLRDLDRTTALLTADGWRPRLGDDVAGALARVIHRRHSWAFEHPDGYQVDLHWHVLQSSRGPGSDAAFLAGAVPLALGTITTRRLCDADLLLHLLEHAGHGEEASKLQWMVDAVHVIRSIPDLAVAGARLARQARAHRLVESTKHRLSVLRDTLHEPAADGLLASLATVGAARPARPGSRRAHLDQFRHGGGGLRVAAGAMAREALDVPLVRRRLAWTFYVMSGRRPAVEGLLTRLGGPFTTTPVGRSPVPAADGWWNLWEPEVVDAICGPGWWYPEPDARGVWTEGAEARLSVPLPPHATTVDLQFSVLGRHGGPNRVIRIRAGGRTHAVLDAAEGHSWHQVAVPVPDPSTKRLEVSLRIVSPARPADLGLTPDPRCLGVLLHRVRPATV